MAKLYVARELSSEDQQEIQKIVRESGALIATPSNIIDIYDMQRYRQESFTEDTQLKAILDNNIFTQILPFVDGRKTIGEPLSNETKIICGIMCFLIYAGIETNPVIALHERPYNSNFSSKENQDYYFRIADHIHPQVFADLAMGKITDIPEYFFKEARSEVDTNPETQDDIGKASYENKLDERYLLIYMNILKAWLLYKSGKNQIERIKTYLEWSYKYSLSDNISTIFIIILLSDKRIAQMIKKINAKNFDGILKEISNATWDLYYLVGLESLHQETGSNEIWFFCTRDKVLLDISQFIFTMSSIESASVFVGNYYPEEGVLAFNDYINNINMRQNRASHRQSIRNNLHSRINKLEDEVFNFLEA